VPITYSGPLCKRRDCRGPAWRDRLCADCWRLARLFNKDPKLFVYEPRYGYKDERDAVELPWAEWEQNAGGGGVADLFARPSARSDPPRRSP